MVIAALAAIVWTLERSVPPLQGREAVEGLGADVEVAFDSLAIPHIAARSDLDAVRALGYLHARERLWAMEVLRRAAEGRFAEAIGSRAIETDKFLRSLDIPRTAHRIAGIVPEESRAVLQAYVAGINAWIAHPGRPFGPEFRVLGITPELWTETQVIEVSRVMSWDLVNAGSELELARARARLGDRVRELFPWIPDTGAVILPKGSGTWCPCGPRRRADAQALPRIGLAAGEVPSIPPLAAEILDAVAMSRASNSWVIGPGRTRSGKPILANDPHLELRAPSLWYLAAIESPGLSVAGATIPGLPIVVLGHNRRIAWGLTNLEADDVDYVIERLSPDSTRVQTPHGWASVEVVRDSIRVKGGRPVPFTLRRTPDGPIVGADPAGQAGDSGGTVRALAMRWVGNVPSDELTALLAVDRAGSWQEFLDAVSGFKSPEQNWVYADVDGNIGYTASGNIPVRKSGIGRLPTPGWTGEGAWTRFLGFQELPRAFNPPEGFIVTANNRLAGAEYPFFVQGSPSLPYRAERIREMILAAGRHVSPADVRRMQMDSLDLFARWARSLAARAARETSHAELARSLEAWDGTMGSDRSEPAVFWAWYRALQRLVYESAGSGYLPGSPLHHWLLLGGSPWGDLSSLSRRALVEAVAETRGRRWADMHTTVSRHALGSARTLELLFGLNVGPLPRAGSLYTVNVADFGQLRPPFVNTHGPSFRQVVDMADVEGAGLIIPTGESGNPRSPHYRDQRARWWNGELWTVPLSAARVKRSATLILAPEN